MYDLLPERYQKKVIIDNQRGCWLWQGEIDKYGYGRAWYKGFRYQAHRIIFWLLREGLQIDNNNQHIDHLCEVRNCVNPDHHEVVTREINHKRIYNRRKRINELGELIGGVRK